MITVPDKEAMMGRFGFLKVTGAVVFVGALLLLRFWPLNVLSREVQEEVIPPPEGYEEHPSAPSAEHTTSQAPEVATTTSGIFITTRRANLYVEPDMSSEAPYYFDEGVELELIDLERFRYFYTYVDPAGQFYVLKGDVRQQ